MTSNNIALRTESNDPTEGLIASTPGQKKQIEAYRASLTGMRLRDCKIPEVMKLLNSLETALGIRDKGRAEIEELGLIANHIRENYPNMTADSMRHAIALLFSEELKRPDGEVISPSDHYQKLSLAFVCEWLNAYRRFSSEAARAVRALLPEAKEPDPTDYDRAVSDMEFRRVCIQAYDAFRAGDCSAFDYILPEVFDLLQAKELSTVTPAEKWELMEDAERWLKLKAQGATPAGNLIEALQAIRDGAQGGKKEISHTTIKRRAMAMACKKVFSILPSSIAELIGFAPVVIGDARCREIVEELKAGRYVGNEDEMFEAVRRVSGR